MLSVIGSDRLHFQPTQQAFEFWESKQRVGSSPADPCSSICSNEALIKTTSQVFLAHLHLISGQISTGRQFHLSILKSDLAKNVIKFLEAFEKNATSKNGDKIGSLNYVLDKIISEHLSAVSERLIAQEFLILFSGLLAVNDALLSLYEPSDEWISKCKLAQNVLTWQLSDKRRYPIAKWVQMVLRRATGLMCLTCAKLKQVCNHEYFLEAFKWFETMVERKFNRLQPQFRSPQRKILMRKLDRHIKASEFAITGVLKMANCLLELRQTFRAHQLIKTFREALLPRVSDSCAIEIAYLRAYADYIEAVCFFEDTNPQQFVIGRLNDKEDKDLKELYKHSEERLTSSATAFENFAPKSSMLASVYTMRGIVRANMSADFTDEALKDLEKATDLEIELKQPSASMLKLLQILRFGAYYKSSSLNERKEKWKKVYDKALKLQMDVFPKVKYENSHLATNLSSSDKTVEPAPTKEVAAESNPTSGIYGPLEPASEYLDCFRKASLNYFKDRLKQCKQDQSTIAELLCHLFIAKYYLYACATSKVNYRQAKVSRLVRLHFGISLTKEDCASISLKKLTSSHGEQCAALALICGFWIVNEAEFCLLDVVRSNLKLFSPSIYTDENEKSTFVKKIAYLKVYFSSGRFRFIDPNWRACKALFETAASICSELKSDPDTRQTEYVAFLRICVGELSYRMYDRIKNFHTFPASLRKNCCSELESVLEEFFRNPDGTYRPSPLVAMCMTTLGNFCEVPNNSSKCEILDYPLQVYQQAYDFCAAAGLQDTELHANLHLSVGMFLYSNSCSNLGEPAFAGFSAAIFKLRQAAQLFAANSGNHVYTAMAQGMISVLYFNHMQLEDQEAQALESFSECLKIELSLLHKDNMLSPWLWKTIEVVRKCRYFFKGSNNRDVWNEVVALFEALRNGTLPSLQDDSRKKVRLDTKKQVFSNLSDPLFDADETYLVETSRHLRDMVYPRKSLPTETEVRCYSRYLLSMWNHHVKECESGEITSLAIEKPFIPLISRVSALTRGSRFACPLFKFFNQPNSKVFLNGLNEYNLLTAKEREAIFQRLQENHWRMLHCAKIEEFLLQHDLCS